VGRILVTGATGFIGKTLVKAFEEKEMLYRAAMRSNDKSICYQESVITGTLTADQDWTDALDGIDIVIHLAGKVPRKGCSLLTYIEQNTTATINLARQAEAANVKRFIFISSIKLNGDKTGQDQQFTEMVENIPKDPYALSKFKAEKGLINISKTGNMEIVIIRPPVVYGPGVKGNFSTMIRWLRLGVPLPFSQISNRRSFIAIDNLVDFICMCIQHPRAANQIFLISDGECISTTTLLERISRALSLKSRLVAVPPLLLRRIILFIGSEQLVDSLLSSLELDISKAINILGWKPIISMEEQIKKMRLEDEAN